MLTESLNISTTANKVAPVAYSPDQFCALTGHAGLVATEFSYSKDEEIYGEDEPAEYVYQIIRGAVRTYKLLSNGRRQIGSFLLPGDVFGEQGLLEKQERSASVIATSSLRALKIEHWEIPRMRRAMPEVVEHLQKTVEERSS